ncbi:hypothetical protein [Desulfosporosinus metallidurans]|uniref:Uncharacterized protein n=1 Tax=Desulfosporosinus metallidurans TaxID=1888891 RepID=A0A1Q8QXC9_9FIRM|nr:hypothetical protein [Desulfosporosinus metallidurans]OLN31989.1 hypothetical protein DSOL_2082 [Desulfosporosinus metallidurans]
MQDTGKNNIEGTVVNVLLYGEGNKITERGALDDYSATMLGGQEGQGGRSALLYFGDLDWEGIRLFFRTREANPYGQGMEQLRIRLIDDKLIDDQHIGEEMFSRRIAISDFKIEVSFE